MSKDKIAKLRAKLRLAEERGFNASLDMIQQFVDTRYNAEVKHRPDSNKYKTTLHTTWCQIQQALNKIRKGETPDGKCGPNQWELPDGTF